MQLIMGWSRGILSILVCLTITLSKAQTGVFFVAFNDRSGSVHSIERPEEFLSERALQRRNYQGIPIQENDLPVSGVYVSVLNGMNGIIVAKTSKWLNGAVVEISDSLSFVQLQGLSFVRKIHRIDNRKEGKTKQLDPDNLRDMYLEMHADHLYGSSFNQIRMLGGNLMHRMGYDGKGKVIAILDAGFPGIYQMECFRKMQDEGRLLGTWDVVENESDVTDNNSLHGTVVLSCMASWWPGIFIGTAPGASYWLLVTENIDSETLQEEYNWVIGAEFADSVGADIINSSLGYTTFDDSLQNHSYADMDGNTTPCSIGADIAASKGILVVNSAGNMGVDPWRHIVAPSDGDSVLAVGAVNENREFAFFSSHGYSADGDVKPNVAAQGWNAVVVWPWNEVGLANGTSFSSPILSGMAASLWQSHPGRTNMEIFHAIEESAHSFPLFDSLLGFGIPDFYRAYINLGGAPHYELDPLEILDVFPVPFSRDLYIDMNVAAQSSCIIAFYDVAGRPLKEEIVQLVSGSINKLVISDPLSGFPSGVYAMRITWNNGTTRMKIVKF